MGVPQVIWSSELVIPAEKLSRQQRERLTDPVTLTAMEAASGTGRAKLDYQLKTTLLHRSPA